MTEILQLVFYGLVVGSVLALAAASVSLSYGILRFANFAQGDFMSLGAYLVLLFYVTLGWPLALALPLAMAGTAAAALAFDQTLFRRLRRTSPVTLLISSVGVALILRSALHLVWGPANRVYHPGVQLPWILEGLRIKPDHVLLLGVALANMVALHLFLQRTRLGKAMRAMADNPDLARASGIRVESVIRLTWMISGALAAVAGFCLALHVRIYPDVGWSILLAVFAAAILGGIGKPYGAAAGGFVIGLTQELSTLFMSAAYKPAIAFAVMVLMLIARPTGLFAGRST